MEVSVVGRSQSKLVTTTAMALQDLGWFCSSTQVFPRQKKVSFDLSRRWRTVGVRLTAKATHSAASVSEKISTETSIAKRSTTTQENVRLFVGLPLDSVVSECNTVNHERAITAGLKALKLLDVEGVELPIWWGVVEKDKMGKYEWSSYLSLAHMVKDTGLKLRVSLCFHASKQPMIPLPTWLSHIGSKAHPSIYFTDRSGREYKDCLSLAVDDLPVLDGKTPLEVYQEFAQSFKSSFSHLLGSTITDVSVSLGPDGELRYPSYPRNSKITIAGVGEFQCYGEHMLMRLRQHAEATGNPKWGLGGPHDVPTYDELPSSKTFFREQGGSWETPYGDFFLSWYSNQLISHGDRILSLASTTFADSPVTVSGKLPFMHSWYKTRSHPSEMTAGFYNTVNRDGYDAVAQMFARNSCRMILPGMDLSERHQPGGSLSSPELLLAQMKAACRKHRVILSGENSAAGAPEGLEQIKKNMCGEDEDLVVLDSFTYQRMGAHFFSPGHFPKFTQFVRSLQEPELHSDDHLHTEEEEENCVSLAMDSGSGKDIKMMQAADA